MILMQKRETKRDNEEKGPMRDERGVASKWSQIKSSKKNNKLASSTIIIIITLKQLNRDRATDDDCDVGSKDKNKIK